MEFIQNFFYFVCKTFPKKIPIQGFPSSPMPIKYVSPELVVIHPSFKAAATLFGEEVIKTVLDKICGASSFHENFQMRLLHFIPDDDLTILLNEIIEERCCAS